MTSILSRAMLLFAVCVQFAGAQFVNSQLRDKAHRIHRVLILPPQFRLTEVGIKGSEEMPDEADRLGDEFQAILSSYLATRSARVLPHSPAGKLSDNDRYLLADIQRKYDTVEVQMLRKPRGIAKGRFSLGTDVAVYPPASAADALIFVRGSGTVRRKSMADALTGGGMWGGKEQVFEGRVTFVDARTGEVLVLLPFSTYGYGWKKTAEEFVPRLADCLLKLKIPLHEFLGRR